MTRLLSWALGLLVTVPRSVEGPTLPDIAITHVSVIDIERGDWRRDVTVLIAANHILDVAPATTVQLTGATRIIDGHQKFLIPGLWDMHVHLGTADRRALGIFLAAGVTSIRDMGSPDAPVAAWRDSIAAGTLPRPALVHRRPWRARLAAAPRRRLREGANRTQRRHLLCRPTRGAPARA